MDGWMDGWIDGWMDGLNCWMNGCIVLPVDGDGVCEDPDVDRSAHSACHIRKSPFLLSTARVIVFLRKVHLHGLRRGFGRRVMEHPLASS